MTEIDTRGQIDAIAIGGGPAGLSAAIELKKRGVARVVVLEREPEAGGIPRQCGHPPFGMREFKRILTGPQYAKKLVKHALEMGVEIRLSTTIVEAKAGGLLVITDNHGLSNLSARRIIYATGVRETPRSARLISGQRPIGVINTGTLQSMVYLKQQRPFKRPVIVGTELVSFSAIQTCRHAAIQPVAMLEANRRVTARWPAALFAKLRRVPLYLNTRLIAIEGKKQVTGVVVENGEGEQRHIDCDGVLLTGQFTPESTLARCGHLAVDPASGGPLIDQFGRCSDPTYFAAGNLLRPVETAGWSWNEGRQIGGWVADDLAEKLPPVTASFDVTPLGPLIKYAIPQTIVLPHQSAGLSHLQLCFTDSCKGELTAHHNKQRIWRKTLTVHPERRVLIPVQELITGRDGGSIELTFTPN